MNPGLTDLSDILAPKGRRTCQHAAWDLHSLALNLPPMKGPIIQSPTLRHHSSVCSQAGVNLGPTDGLLESCEKFLQLPIFQVKDL